MFTYYIVNIDKTWLLITREFNSDSYG